MAMWNVALLQELHGDPQPLTDARGSPVNSG
jgi:hypothetical protein